MVYPFVTTTFRHVIVVWFETMMMLKVAKKESQLEHCVQEPDEVCIGDGGPPILVHKDVGTCLGIINYQTS